MNELTQYLQESAQILWDWSKNYYPYSIFLWVPLLYFLYYRLIYARLFISAFNPFRGKITRVVRVADGDTIIVGNPKRKKRRHKVRLIGVDTPESVRSLYQGVMPYGKEASDYTKKRLKKGKRVFLYYDRENRDKFGRLLAYVYLGNGEFFNATLVKKGFAFAKEYPPNVKHANYFRRLERKAKRRKRGLWTIYQSQDDLHQRYLRSKKYKRFKRVYG